MKPLAELVNNNNILVVGHRGSPAKAPENTLPSVKKALESGVDMIEVDIQFTADNKIVAHHDPELGRVFSGKGKIADMSYQELSRYNKGQWDGQNFDGINIPLLDEVINTIRDKAYLNIEIKDLPSADISYISLIVEEVEKNQYLDNTLFGSFSEDIIKCLKQINPDIKTASIFPPGSARTLSDIHKNTGCEVFICSIFELNEELAAEALHRNIFVGVYGVYDKKTLEIALKNNVKAIATDDPDKVITLLQNNK
ncbi:MAG: glycerophosphodiester phosphodiesterase [Candidatus Kapaibacterium sp.]